MDITNRFDADETRCDQCGAPTPRLTPAAAVELCDDCASAQQPHPCFYCGGPCEADDPYCSERCSINAQSDNEGGF